MLDNKDEEQKAQEAFEASEEFKKHNEGFNQGYLMSKFDPQTLDYILSKAPVNKDYYRMGMEQGKKCQEREKFSEMLREFKRFKADQKKDREK
jgi:hypothetical protein